MRGEERSGGGGGVYGLKVKVVLDLGIPRDDEIKRQLNDLVVLLEHLTDFHHVM